jgi:hypothetical protein
MKPAYSLLLSALVFASPAIADEITIEVTTPVPDIQANQGNNPIPAYSEVVMTFDTLSGTSSISTIPNSPYAQGINFSELVLQSWSISADGALLAAGTGGTMQGMFHPIFNAITPANTGPGYFFDFGFSQGANSWEMEGDLSVSKPPTVASLSGDPVSLFFSQVMAAPNNWHIEASESKGAWGQLVGSSLAQGGGVVTMVIDSPVSVPEPPLLPLMALGLASVFLGVHGRRLLALRRGPSAV